MDTSPIPGFITRKQAAERCGRSERTLQRYWSRAIELQREQVLKHLRLRTEDAKIIDGPDVTKNLIDDLKKQGQNPTWFVHAAWAQETYGPRSEQPATTPDGEPARSEPPSSRRADTPADETGLVAALKEQITELQRDKDRLHEELGIKNEQIKEANARTRESNTLMQQIQTLLGDMQQRAFPALSANTNPSHITDAEVVPHSDAKPARPQQPSSHAPASAEEGSARRGKTAPRKKASSAAASNRAPQAQKPRQGREDSAKPRWYDTPTLKRLASRLRG